MRSPLLSGIAIVASISVVLFSTACDDFFVSGSTIDHIELSPSAVYLKTGETKQITANSVTVDGTSSDITSSATWTSATPGTATAVGGLVTAVAAGSTTVSAAQGGVTGTATVIVNTQTLGTTLTVTPNNPSVSVNQTVQLKAVGTFPDNSTQDLTNFVKWSSSNTSNATVSSTGLVTGKTSNQTATITATISTASSSASGSVTVNVQ